MILQKLKNGILITLLSLALWSVSSAAIGQSPSPSPLEPTRTVVLKEENTVVLRGEVDAASASKVAQKILESDQKEIYLVINSPGGSVLAGLQLIDTIKGSGKNVNCVAIFAASMAFDILQACTKRLSLENSLLMQHVPSYGMKGDEPNNWSFAELMRRMHDSLSQREADRIGITRKELQERTRDDWWVFGSEIKEAGVVDEVVKVTCATELTKKTVSEKAAFLFFQVEVEFSGCPLISAPTKMNTKSNYEGLPNPQVQKEFEKIKKKYENYNYLDLLSKESKEEASREIKEINK